MLFCKSCGLEIPPDHRYLDPPCARCKGRGTITVHGGGSGDPEWDADDQPCPECALLRLPDNHSRIYPLNEDGSICDWYFVGDGDQITDEQAAADYAEENPGTRFILVTFKPAAVAPWVPE